MSDNGKAPPLVHELLDRVWAETSVGYKRVEIAGGSGRTGAFRADFTNLDGITVRLETPATRERLPAGAPEAWSRWRRFERETLPWREIV